VSADVLAARSALVIAPHPDDEALGCGGLIAALVECGADLAVVFVTDGGASHLRSRLWPRPRLAALRAEEASAALAALGASGAACLHLGLADAGIVRGSPVWQRAVERTVQLVATLRPAIVLAPWRRDPHRDHRDSHALTVEALKRAEIRPRLLEYPIWLDELEAEDARPRPGEAMARHVDVSPWRERKRAAVAAHRSQLGHVVDDDPSGFVLSEATIRRLTSGDEVYFEVQA
jgi:LmbE family N-acetylglucosaminyl deacetylase